MSIFHKILKWLDDAAYVWRFELRQVLRDEGVLLFCIVVPLIYPLLYSWVYNNENIREVPVVVVDQSHSALSRQFIRMCDASSEVHVVSYAVDLDDAQSLVSRQIVKGIYLIPEDFATRVNRMQQATVSVYCDMALMLTYKAIYQTAMAVSQQMGAEIQTKLSGNYTAREDLITTSPLDVEEVAMFNPQAGYGTAVLPAVLMLIIQQTLALGIGLAAGTARERNRYGDLVPIHPSYGGIGRIISGKTLCYLMVYAIMATYLTIAVPKMFHFIHIATWQDLSLLRFRENVILLVVFVSLPLLFLTGVSWPQTYIPGCLQGVSWLFPSTFGVRAYLRLNSMGASIADVSSELRCLWIQVAAYLGTTCLVYGHQLRITRQHASERLDYLRKKREVRLALKKRQQ